MNQQTSIQFCKGVGEKRAGLFQKLGVSSLGALLRFYPRAYEDWSRVCTIAQAPFDEVCCVKAIVAHPPTQHRIRKGMTLYKTSVTDGTSLMDITIFNNQYAAARLEEGREFLFWGKVGGRLGRREMSAPMIEPAVTGERIRPIYRQTQGLTSPIIEKCVRQALETLGDQFDDCLPDALRKRLRLCHLRFALENIHFPSSQEALETARQRLIFEELFVLQLGLLRLKGRNRTGTASAIAFDCSDEFLERLPFRPTGAQYRAVKQAAADMLRKVPMSRLLQGDVGSGKTAVAAALIYTAAKNGMQSAIMAPTEILAEQHLRTMETLLKGTGLQCALLTGSTKAAQKREIKAQLASGELPIVIGTHALIQKDVSFRQLGFVVTDEQHRFGVAQRTALAEKGGNPHTLVMSATPIPRTLALMIYGDLDVCVLDELPPGRTPVETYAVGSALRPRVYRYIRRHLDEGRQGYVVCPLVEEGESELTAAQEYAQRLQAGPFQAYTVGLLHGKMKAAEKEKVMRAFSEGTIQLLVSTTVVEVGVDVPNAVIMVIENAERFGLSQLHQLRGRVGRGKAKSTCILISDAQNEEARRRLQIMHDTTDGFRIADEDLKLRGPGDFFGARQHGLPELRIADMLEDMETLRLAQKEAKALLREDPGLVSPAHLLLASEVEALFRRVGDAGLS